MAKNGYKKVPHFWSNMKYDVDGEYLVNCKLWIHSDDPKYPDIMFTSIPDHEDWEDHYIETSKTIRDLNEGRLNYRKLAKALND